MPLFDYLCPECGKSGEFLLSSSDPAPTCPECGSQNMKKMLSAHAAVSGSSKHSLPGAGDTGCCGSSPHQATGCAGPGSCCGRH